MPSVLRRLGALVLLAGPAAAVQAPSPCVGWFVDRAEPTSQVLGAESHAVAVDGGTVLRAYQALGGPPRALWVERHELDPALGRYVLRERFSFPGWQATWRPPDVALSGRMLALQPGAAQSASQCDVVTLAAPGPQLTRLELGGVRHAAGRLTAIAGDVVLAVDSVGFFRPRLNVIARDAQGVPRLEQAALAAGVRFAFPPEDTAYLAADGRRAVVAARLVPQDAAALVFERDAQGTWAHVATLQRPPGPYGLVGSTVALALEGDRAALVLEGHQGRATVWLYERHVGGGWAIAQSFPGGDRDTGVALGAGRLALSRGGATELLERDAAGAFATVRSYVGLEAVLHLDGERVAGLDRQTVRVVPLRTGDPPVVQACRDRGVVVCAASAPGAPTLRAYLEYGPWPAFTPRVAAALEGALPGSTALAFLARDVGANPALGGALCLAGQGALRAAPRAVDASGRATLAFEVGHLSLPALAPEAVVLQGFVLGPARAATHALRVVP